MQTILLHGNLAARPNTKLSLVAFGGDRCIAYCDGLLSPTIMLSDSRSGIDGAWRNMSIARLPNDFFLSIFNHPSDCHRVF